MRLVTWTVVIGLAMAAPAAAQGPPYGPDDVIPEGQRQQLAALLDVVRHADRVEALPVAIEGVGLSSTARIVEEPVAVDTASGRSLGRRLVAYDWTRWSPSACMFNPAVAFRFRRGAEATVVQICFECGEMALDGIEGRFSEKKILSASDRRAWLRAAKKAFPRELGAVQE